jgi:hypothetical protein
MIRIPVLTFCLHANRLPLHSIALQHEPHAGRHNSNRRSAATKGTVPLTSFQNPWRVPARVKTSCFARNAWWSQTESNRRPLPCHGSALPTELWPHFVLQALHCPGRTGNLPPLGKEPAAPSCGRGRRWRSTHLLSVCQAPNREKFAPLSQKREFLRQPGISGPDIDRCYRLKPSQALDTGPQLPDCRVRKPPCASTRTHSA